MAPLQIAAADGENEAAAFGAGEPLALRDPDWLLNRLTISGAAGAIARFRAVAQGTNVALWHLDLDEEEARLFAPMATGGVEARVLAKELREIIAARHDRALAFWTGPGTCPLDLHRLIPIPRTILQLGEHDPAAAVGCGLTGVRRGRCTRSGWLTGRGTNAFAAPPA